MTPDEDDQVRRALSGAAGEAPRMPPEVAARLEGVLAELAAPRREEQVDRPPDGTDGPDGPTRSTEGRPAALRRRHRTHLLVAAAAVAVIVAAGGAVALRGGGSEDQATSGAASSASRGESSAVPRLHRATLARDVRRLVDAPEALAAAPGTTTRASCAQPAAAPGGRLVAVRLDGRPATLLLGPVRDGSRIARVYSCADAGTPVASLGVPAR